MAEKKPNADVPLEVVGEAWQRHVLRDDESIDFHASTFCVLDEWQTALRRRDVFATRRGPPQRRPYRLSWQALRTASALLRGQEDQLDALGLVLNMIVLWNTIYIEAALNLLRKEDYPKKDDEVCRRYSTRISICWATTHFRCRTQWPKENCGHCVIQRTPTHEDP